MCIRDRRYSKAPRDVIIRKFLYRTYTDRITGVKKKSSTKSAAYFHLNMDCVRKVAPAANIRDIMVHDEVRPILVGDEDRQSVLRTFGIEMCTDD